MTTNWQPAPRMTPREQQIEALAWGVRDTWTDEDEYSPWTVAAALLDGPVARMIADAEQAALRAAEWRMFGTVDGDLIEDGELPVGEMRRLLWLSHPQGGSEAEQAAERRGAVKALRGMAARTWTTSNGRFGVEAVLAERADAIENGADL